MADAMTLSPSLSALAQVCREDGYTLSLIDEYSQQLVRVDNGAYFFFAGIGRVANYPLNTAVAASVAKDKAFAYQVLEKAGIAVPDYGHFFLEPLHQGLRGQSRERADAFSYAERLGYPVFVKPIDGSKGAFCDIAYDSEDLDALLQCIARFHHAVMIQRVLNGEDRRLFLLDDKAIFGYRRMRAALQGDGTSTVGQLLKRYNGEFVGQGVSDVKPDSPFLRETLRSRGWSIDHVLREGEEISVSPRGNVSAGGRLLDYSEDVPEAWAVWARRLAAALGLRVCAIDFFAEQGVSLAEGLRLVEVNSNPNLDGLIAAGHETQAHAIWRQVARTFFAECRGWERGRT